MKSKQIMTSLMMILVLSISAAGITQAQATPAPQNAGPATINSATPLVGPDPDSGGATIDNGVVQIGINNGGHLDRPSDGVGLRPLGGPDALSPGCFCEGWGVLAMGAGLGPGLSGFANQALGTGGIEVDSFASTPSTAVSTVMVPTIAAPVLKVTHDYHPSTSPRLYEVEVTFLNLSGVPIDDVFYRRVMDWDIPPTVFAEYVTVQGTATTTKLFASGNNGFMSADQLASGNNALGGANSDYETGGLGPGTYFSDFTDLGVSDHGSVFDLKLGPLAVGESKSFKIYYGVAENEDDAETALTVIDAELFSLGQSSTTDGPTLGTPWTFIWAFEGVGGVSQFPVGGEFLPIDNSALLIAGVSANAVWILPMLAGLAGAGIYLTRSKFNWI